MTLENSSGKHWVPIPHTQAAQHGSRRQGVKLITSSTMSSFRRWESDTQLHG